MLYGKELSGTKWMIRENQNSKYLVFSKEPQMYTTVPMFYIERELNKMEIDDLEKLNYYLFPYNGSPRFVFITTEPVDFATLDYPLIRVQSEFAYIVNGALYDLKKNKFVKFSRGTTFFNFVLYDSGIPHVIYLEESHSYLVMYINKGIKSSYNYIQTKSETDPVFVSRLWYNASTYEFENHRVIFLESDIEERLAYVYSGELDLSFVLNDVSFKDAVFEGDRMMAEAMYYTAVHKDVVPNRNTNLTVAFIKNKHLVYDDAVIMKDENGMFGECSFLRFFDGRSFYDSKDSFMIYEKVPARGNLGKHNVIKVVWRKNDFENGIAYEDITYNKTYESEDEYDKASDTLA